MGRTVEERRAQLLERRAGLESGLRAIEASLEETPSPDVEERATEREGDEVLESLGQAEQLELRQIAAALGRIDDGSYGSCVRCGATIAEERLDLLPATPFCRHCAI